jgi:heme/copper-type cytochrome/quinol oxidase subunit 2
MRRSSDRSRAPWLALTILSAAVVAGAVVTAQNKRDVSVTGRKYTYVVSDSNDAVIRVRKDDLVTVTFSVSDIAHSFTISDDVYRLDRRAESGKPVTLSFRASKVGEFEIRCTLAIDERCQKEMRGRLIVTDK